MLSYYLFRVGAIVAPRVPVPVGFALCDLVAWLIFWLFRSKRRAVLCNLSHVLPNSTAQERHRTARRIIQNNLKNYFDLFRAHKLTSAQFDQQVEVRGMEHVREAEKLGKGVIALAAHLGSFSFVSQVASKVQLHFNLTVEPIKPPELYEFVRSLREVDGQTKLIPVGGIEVRNILRALKRNEMVCMAIDRDVTGNGVPQEFFGAMALLPSGVAELALRTGAVLVAVHPYRVPGYKNVVEFQPGFVLESTGDRAADVANGNARLLREIEKLIRATPDQWVVLQPIWADCTDS